MARWILDFGLLSCATPQGGATRRHTPERVRRAMVDCTVALPGKLFYTTPIPICLWFLDRDKASPDERVFVNRKRDRRGETIFSDGRFFDVNLFLWPPK